MTTDLTKPLLTALAGFGKVAELAHLPALQSGSGILLKAVAEPLAERRELAGQLFPKARVYGNLAELLAAESGLDAVVICTPPRQHTELVLAALKHGCHVLCEQPLTLDLTEVAELEAAARQAGRALVTVHNWKYAPIPGQHCGIVEKRCAGGASHHRLAGGPHFGERRRPHRLAPGGRPGHGRHPGGPRLARLLPGAGLGRERPPEPEGQSPNGLVEEWTRRPRSYCASPAWRPEFFSPGGPPAGATGGGSRATGASSG